MLRRRGIENILIEKAKDGNDEAFQVLLERYKGYISKRESKYFFRDMDNADIYQEIVFHGFYRALSYYKEDLGTKYITLVDAILRNHFSRLINKAMKMNFDVSIDSNEEFYNNIILVNDNFHLEDEALINHKKIVILRALSTVPKEEFNFLLDIYDDNYSMSQYTRDNDISYGKARSKKDKILSKLRASLKKSMEGTLKLNSYEEEYFVTLQNSFLPNINDDIINNLFEKINM